MGSVDGAVLYEAWEPDLAYDNVQDEYLVVWRGDEELAPLVNNEWEVFGQRLTGWDRRQAWA